MRICFISRRFFPAISGMSVYALNLLRQLVANGHDVVMVSQYRGDAEGVKVYGGGPPPPVPGVEVVGLESVGEQRIGDGSDADFEADVAAMVDAVCGAHRRRPLDVIHAQYAYPCGLAAIAASRITGVPNVVSIQGGDGHWVGGCCQTHRDAMAAVLGHAGELLIGSRSFAREVCENHGVPVDRFTIVPGATDIERFAPAAGKPLGSVGDPPTFLYHGRVDARKGNLELIDAFAEVLKFHPAARLIVSGIGPDVDAVAHRIDSLGLGDRAQMTGYAGYEDAPRVYHRGDVFVSPTYAEGFSNTILEAMASGLPVISTDTVGVVDCLTDGVNGLLVPVRSVDALSGAMKRMLEDANLRRRLAEAAIRDVRRKYSWPVVGGLIEDAYRRVAGTSPSDGWTHRYDIASVSADNADMSCRFRRAPHLL